MDNCSSEWLYQMTSITQLVKGEVGVQISFSKVCPSLAEADSNIIQLGPEDPGVLLLDV